MLNKIKNLFNKPPEKVEKVEEIKPPKAVKPKEVSAKEKATLAGEPYVNIISVELDPNNINNGSFELDWNSIFITQLVKAGYMKKKEDTDSEIIDRWFQDICRNVLRENYEQQWADPSNREMFRPIHTRDIGNGRTEVS